MTNNLSCLVLFACLPLLRCLPVCGCLPCFKEDNDILSDRLIREKYCERCDKFYVSNNEYNKHIVGCNQVYGEL